MPFYLKKSLRVGPMRFNLSGSGIGASIGVKGFRIGTGPRGHYVHAGIGGLYYRATLGNKPVKRTSDSFRPQSDDRGENLPLERQSMDPTLGSFVEITSGDVERMTDETSAAFLSDLNERYTRVSWAKWGAICAVTLILWLFFSQKTVFLPPVLGGVTIGLITLYAIDQYRKTCVLFYDLSDAPLESFKAVCEAFDQLGKAASIARIDESAVVLDRKYHAGAGEVVKVNNTKLVCLAPPYVKTNIPTPFMDAGNEKLFFLPDRLLVFRDKKFGAVAYSDLKIQVEAQRFVIDGRVPSDAQIVSKTWRYVNKKGGPDRRFKNNRELPIGLYEYLSLSSRTGLREIFQFSRRGNGDVFASKINALLKAFSTLAEVRVPQRTE